MAAVSNPPRNQVNILERFNDTELLNCCWSILPSSSVMLVSECPRTVQTSEAMGDRALGGEPPHNKCSEYFL